MIRYALKCDRGHESESWFANAAGYERLRDLRQITCPTCGSQAMERALMAPALVSARGEPAPCGAEAEAETSAAPGAGTLSTPTGKVEEALAALRRQIEEHSDYVGMDFALEARRMHEGEVPERSIHGEARPDEARRLIEDGIPVAPLPFMLHRRTN